MHLFLIRHGECLGQCDPQEYANPDSCLSVIGKEQARRTAHRLKREGITHILSSPLLRALETAQPIAAMCEISTIQVWLELREGFSGRHRGLSRQTLQERFPNLMMPKNITDSGWHHGDDTYPAFWERARQGMRQLQETFTASDRVAIITHGGIGNYLLHMLLGISQARPTWFELANGSLSHLRIVPDPQSERPDWPLYPPVEVEVLTINDTAHLAETE